MTAVDIRDTVTATLCLRSEEGINLSYVVEIEDKNKTYRCYSSENHNQALLVARKVFEKLKTRKSTFAVMIESPLGLGITYDINEFNYTPNFEDTEDFYNDLTNELEYLQAVQNQNVNSLFRTLVGKHKLNEYQEQRFLYHWKKFCSGKRI